MRKYLAIALALAALGITGTTSAFAQYRGDYGYYSTSPNFSADPQRTGTVMSNAKNGYGW